MAPPDKICERPTESIPQFTTTLADNIELFPGIYPIEIEYHADHALKEIQIIINDEFYRSIPLADKKDGVAKAEFGMNQDNGSSQTVIVRVVDVYGYSSSRNYHIKVLENDDTPPVIVTQDLENITLTSGDPLHLTGVIQDGGAITRIQIFVDGIIYGTIQDTKSYDFTLQTPNEMDVGTHTVTIQATDFQKNTATKVYSVTVE